jgi:hypothetical protein
MFFFIGGSPFSPTTVVAEEKETSQEQVDD